MVNSMFKSKKRKLKEECWNINYSFIKWLHQHLKVYKEDAGKTVDLTYHKFNYKDKEYTQLEIIDRLIELTDALIFEEKYFDMKEETDAKVKEMLDLFVLVFPTLWW